MNRRRPAQSLANKNARYVLGWSKRYDPAKDAAHKDIQSVAASSIGPAADRCAGLARALWGCAAAWARCDGVRPAVLHGEPWRSALSA